ncbi:MAG: hypothetical protein Q9170_005609 [Blastenia crenularia]
MSKKRKAPPRAAKKDPYSIDELLTSSNSRLIDIDLHGRLAAFFSEPQNWAQVPETDKDFIRSLLPPHVELNDDGSIPTSFWKYNPEFRLDCRNLQEDLRSGRMDPVWQRQAAEAMEERAAGKFDDFKEQEFEEYWGQKQKVAHNVLAGHASKVRLQELLKEEVFKVGDVWSFNHTFGRGEDAIRVEKECKIVMLEDKSLTFAIPPGQLKFARRIESSDFSKNDDPVKIFASSTGQVVSANMSEHAATGVTVEVTKADNANDDTKVENTKMESTKMESTIMDGDIPLESEQGSFADVKENIEETVKGGEDTASTPIVERGIMENGFQQQLPDAISNLESKSPSMTLRSFRRKAAPISPMSGSIKSVKSSALSSLASSPTYAISSPPKDDLDLIPAATEYDVILYQVTGLYALEKKILEIDGRAKPSSRTASTWRDIRCRRNEQDMGSLFEMRDEYYAYKVAKGNYCRPEVRK